MWTAQVDKGFVAQTADVMSGSILKMNEQQKAIGGKNVPLEVKEGVKHHEGKVLERRELIEWTLVHAVLTYLP